MSNNEKIVCSNIWKLFGPDEKRILKDLDPSLSRSEVQEKTGHVVAVKDVSFSIQKGETFTIDSLAVKRSAKGVSPEEWDNVIGSISTKQYKKDEVIDACLMEK